jgi:hypothetical protein
MAIKYNQSKEYRDLTLDDMYEKADEQAWKQMKEARWGEGDETECPECGLRAKHYFIKTRKQWTCKGKGCQHRFSVTSSTPFASHKLPLRKILLLLYHFISAPQGQSCNELHAKFGCTLKTVFHNFGKIREVLFETQKTTLMEGVVHIDSAHFCGKPRRSCVRTVNDSAAVNHILRSRKDSISPVRGAFTGPENKDKVKKNRRIVLVFAECDTTEWDSRGTRRVMTFVVNRLNSDLVADLINKYISPKAVLMTDYGTEFSKVGSLCPHTHFQVNHSKMYMTEDGVHNNMAELYFSRLRRAEFGTYNGMRPKYLAFYSAEFTWRSNVSKVSLLTKFNDLFRKLMSSGISRAFCNYNHGHRLPNEYTVG